MEGILNNSATDNKPGYNQGIYNVFSKLLKWVSHTNNGELMCTANTINK